MGLLGWFRKYRPSAPPPKHRTLEVRHKEIIEQHLGTNW
jgi:hypothetical protein